MAVCGLLVISLSHWTNFWHLTPENMSIQRMWALHRYSLDAGLQTLREISLCVIIALQITQSYLMSAMKPCTYSQPLERVLVPAWLAVHGSAMGTMLLKNGTMADHGQPWYIWPWSTLVLLTMLLKNGTMADHGQPWYIWPWSTMVLLTMLLKNGTMADHGQPW